MLAASHTIYTDPPFFRRARGPRSEWRKSGNGRPKEKSNKSQNLNLNIRLTRNFVRRIRSELYTRGCHLATTPTALSSAESKCSEEENERRVETNLSTVSAVLMTLIRQFFGYNLRKRVFYSHVDGGVFILSK